MLKTQSDITWVDVWRVQYTLGFKSLGIDINTISLDAVCTLKEDDVLILKSYDEYMGISKFKYNCMTVMQANATACNPYIYHINPTGEYDTLRDITINLIDLYSYTKKGEWGRA